MCELSIHIKLVNLLYLPHTQKKVGDMEFAKDKLEWLEFDLLKSYPLVAHGVFLRHGGTSEGNFSSLNSGDAVGDHPDNVKVNRELIREVISVPHIAFAKQEHNALVFEVTAANRGKIPPADAIFTRVKDCALAVTHADCQAAIIYDPKQEVIAVVHAGYKGLAQDIYGKTIEALVRDAKCHPQDLLVCISPSLGPCHSEFINYKTELPESFWEHQNKSHYFDLWVIAEKQLLQAGVHKNKIEMPKLCTYCESKDFFSHRREKKTGRHATVAAIKS